MIVVPLLAAGAVLAGHWLPLPGALALSVVVGLLVAALLVSVQSGRLRRLADAVSAWLGTTEHRPVTVTSGPDWERFAVAVNALGAAHARRGQRLQEERALRRHMLDPLEEPAMLFGSDGRLLHANDEARARFGLRHDEPLTPAQAVGHAAAGQVVDEARVLGRPVQVDFRVDDRDFAAAAAPIGEDVLVLLTDHTERRRIDELRREFVANASHELKTPVAGIQSLSEALLATLEHDPGRARTLTERLADEAQRMGRLVRDLLDLRRLEEAVDGDREPVDLAGIVRRELQRIRPLAAGRDLVIEANLPNAAVIAGARHDLLLIVANLLDNAVGYNRPGGRIAVSLRRAEGNWQLEVTDTGIGIPRADLDRIFERFYRVDVARSRATGGTGLGLAIVRHAVQRHGGSIAVDSILGEGTTLTVTLPVG